MDFKKHMEIAWNLTLRHIVALILMTLVMFGVGFLTLGILGPVTMAGYMQSILRMMRDGREPKIQDLFSEMRLFLPLLGFGIVVFIAAMVGFMLLFLPGVVVILAVTFCCLYMLPLMTDRKLGLVDAIKKSYAMSIKDQLVEHLVVVIIFMAIVMIGSSVFIGALFTQPLATIFLLSTYEEKISS
jgi:uncharacterized membrane protein